jgi:hypothetical protein
MQFDSGERNGRFDAIQVILRGDTVMVAPFRANQWMEALVCFFESIYIIWSFVSFTTL